MLKCQMPPRRKQPAIEYFPDREVCNMKTAEGKRMYKDRLYEMEVRQGFTCAICTRIAGGRMEFDHQDGRGANGGHRDDAITDFKGGWINAALCHDCNTKKGSKRYAWIDGKYVPRKEVIEYAAQLQQDEQLEEIRP